MATVLIVGAGPSGLALALALLKNGISVRIIEKRPTHAVGQRGSGVSPRTLELYRILGVLPHLRALAGPLQPMQMHTSPEGPKPVAELKMMEDMENTPRYPHINPAMLGQDRHEGFLRDYIAKEYNTHVELGTELKSFVQTEDYVEARLLKQVEGKEVEEMVRTEFLVGADGARSVVRKQLGLTFLGESHQQFGMVVGDVHIKSGIPDREYWRSWGDQKKSFVGLRPFETDDDSFNFIIGGSEIDLHKVSNDRDELYKQISSTIGREIEFGDLIWCGIWSPNIRMVDKFGQGRVYVAGDAAHVHSPTGGQGMNSGVQDAVNLGWKMAWVVKGLAPPSLLQSYTDERLPVIAAMLNKTSELMNKTFRPGNGAMDASAFTRGWELRQLEVNYRGTPFVVDERVTEKDVVADPYRGGSDGRMKAGDRAPDAPGLLNPGDGSATTLFDVFSPSKHTVLLFARDGNVPDRVLEAVEAVFPQGTAQTVVIYPQSSNRSSTTPDAKASRLFVDREGHALEHYNVGPQDAHRVIVVRPDGYIGAMVEGEEGLKRYGNLVFGSKSSY